VTTSGSLGLLFAPALPLILYAIIVQQFRTGPGVRVEDMFLAGLLPGLLMLVLLVAFSHHVGRALPRQPFEWKKALATLREAAWEAPLPVVVLGSVYGGLVAVSEAAALTVLYVLVVEVLVLREIRIRDLPRVMGEAMTLVGAVLVILGLSLASTNYLIDAGVPERLFEAVQALVTDRLTFLLLLNGFLLVLGTMLDIFSALVLVVPLLLPVALGYGIDPVHLGIIFLANLQIGYLTPPIGINLFIASQRFGKPVAEVWSAALPWLLVLLLALAVITYWPALSLFLPGRL
jgi:tripartite ATP-independent transporter DctM subunit